MNTQCKRQGLRFSQVLGLDYANDISEYSIRLEGTTMEQTRQAHSNKERVKSREADEAEETEPTGQNQLDRTNWTEPISSHTSSQTSSLTSMPKTPNTPTGKKEENLQKPMRSSNKTSKTFVFEFSISHCEI